MILHRLRTFTLLMAGIVCAVITNPVAAGQAAGGAKSLRVVMDDNYPPYVFKDDQGNLKGITIDQWRLWEQKTGVRAELSGMEWSEAQRRMQAGQFDVIDTIFRNEKREKIYDFTKPYARLEVPIFFHRDISGIRNPEDVKGFVVAAKSGDNAIDVLRMNGVTSIAEYPSYEKIIEAARDGKVKVFTVDLPPAHYYLHKMGIQEQFRETAPMYSGEFHRAVPKGRENLLAEVEKGFAGIAPAEYRAIDKRWMGAQHFDFPLFRYLSYGVALLAALLAVLLLWLRLLRRAVYAKTRELAASEQKFCKAFNQAPLIMSISDIKTGRYLEVNNYFCEISGFSSNEAVGHTPVELGLLSPAERDRIVNALDSDGSVRDLELNFTARDGRSVVCLYSAETMHVDDSDRLLSIAQDITGRKQAEAERQKLEQQLLHAQKLESLGVLAGGIAHDFNNILMVIMGHAGLAIMRSDEKSQAVESLKQIELAAARAADLAKQMLAYSGQGKFVVENIDLNSLLDEMLHMLEVSISKKAELRLNRQKNLPLVEADATQMRQVIMNLVINASEAIGDRGGVISITTGCMECSASYLKDVWLDEGLAAGRYVYLEIVDNGCGMDRETLSRLFDPFFSTKFTGRGLGMSAVLGIVRGHKGAIKVYSVPDNGSSFKVLLPAGGKAAELSEQN